MQQGINYLPKFRRKIYEIGLKDEQILTRHHARRGWHATRRHTHMLSTHLRSHLSGRLHHASCRSTHATNRTSETHRGTGQRCSRYSSSSSAT
jgi:hypothetical protein